MKVFDAKCYLLELIAQSDGPNSRIPSEREIARLSEFPQGTVNRAVAQLLGEGRLVREGRRLFVSTHSGQIKRSGEILLLLPTHGHFGKSVEHGAREALRELGYVTRTLDSGGDDYDVRRDILKALQKPLPFIAYAHCSRLLDDLLPRIHVPAVFVGSLVPGHPSVAIDNLRAGKSSVTILSASGHRDLVFFRSASGYGFEVENERAEGYRLGCHEAGLIESAKRVIRLESEEICTVKATILQVLCDHPSITAFVGGSRRTALLLKEALRHTPVPEDIKLFGFDIRVHQSIDGQETDVSVVGNIAAGLLHRVVNKRHPIEATHVLVPPITIHPSAPPQAVRPFMHSPNVENLCDVLTPWYLNHRLEDRERQVILLNETPFPGIEAYSSAFTPVSLHAWMNRSITRSRSWLGGHPLLHLPTGRQVIHGIPFNIIAEGPNGKSAIVLRSRRVRSSAGVAIPSELQIQILRQVKAFFFLHACGWATQHERFAEYRLVFADGSSESIPLIPFSTATPTKSQLKLWRAESNIQDWWRTFPQISSEFAKPYVVTQDGDPIQYTRYLYVLKWQNPRPEKIVAYLNLISNPKSETTLGVLAITIA